MGEVGGLSEAERNLAAHVIDREGNVWRIVRDGGMATRAVYQGAISIGIAALERDYGPLTPLAARAAAPDALREPLPIAVERGAECFHGSPRGCISYRCGSNCSQRFDRMHPCPACLIAEIHDLHAALAERPTDGAGT